MHTIDEVDDDNPNLLCIQMQLLYHLDLAILYSVLMLPNDHESMKTCTVHGSHQYHLYLLIAAFFLEKAVALHILD